jgi:hypothetical protein
VAHQVGQRLAQALGGAVVDGDILALLVGGKGKLGVLLSGGHSGGSHCCCCCCRCLFVCLFVCLFEGI